MNLVDFQDCHIIIFFNYRARCNIVIILEKIKAHNLKINKELFYKFSMR